MYDIFIYILLYIIVCIVSPTIIAVGAWMLVYIVNRILDVYQNIRIHFKH